MQKMLAALAMIAGLLGAVAYLMGAIGAPGGAEPSEALAAGALSIDRLSFAAGFGAGILAVKLYRVPWGSLPRALAAMILGWRRNVAMMGLCAMFAGVLLFY